MIYFAINTFSLGYKLYEINDLEERKKSGTLIESISMYPLIQDETK